MNVFARTFLPAAAESGLTIGTMSRQLVVFRRCVEPDDTTILVTRCIRPDRPTQGDFLLLLTNRRLVVIQQTRLLRRLRLHLNTELRHLSNVTWNADPFLPAVEFAATAIDGIRERFLIRVGRSRPVRHVEALLSRVFRSVPTTAGLRSAAPVTRDAAPRAGQRETALVG